MDVVDRRAARVLVLDEDDALLLIHGFDPDDRGAGTWWFTPGGGLEDAESFEAAARRELAEETGAHVDALLVLDGERRTEFVFGGRLFRQTERYFATRVARFEPSSDGWTELETRATLELRWWTLADFTAAQLRTFPDDLAARWASAAQTLPRQSG